MKLSIPTNPTSAVDAFAVQAFTESTDDLARLALNLREVLARVERAIDSKTPGARTSHIAVALKNCNKIDLRRELQAALRHTQVSVDLLTS